MRAQPLSPQGVLTHDVIRPCGVKTLESVICVYFLCNYIRIVIEVSSRSFSLFFKSFLTETLAKIDSREYDISGVMCFVHVEPAWESAVVVLVA